MFIIRTKLKKSCFFAKNVAKKQDFFAQPPETGAALHLQLAFLRFTAFCQLGPIASLTGCQSGYMPSGRTALLYPQGRCGAWPQ